MEMNEWVKLIVSVLSGLAAGIPLVYQLVKYVEKAVKEKNWPGLMQTVMTYMQRAETMFENGADRKEWVIAMVMASAEAINYPVDIETISKMIDDLCAMSKVVNAPTADTNT